MNLPAHMTRATQPGWTGRLVACVLAALLGVLLGTTAFAQSVPQAEARFDAAAATLEQREAAFEAERRAYEAELEAVERFRELDGVTPFDAIELREALQRANTAAEAMRARDEEAREAAAALEAARAELVDALRAEIARREARFGQLSAGQVMAEVSALNALQQRVAALSRPVPDGAGRVPIDEILDGLPQTAEEMWAAADELDDHAARLERELQALRDQLDDALVQARLADRVSEFGLEESLFDDGAGRRAPSRGTTAVAAGAEDDGDQATSDDSGAAAGDEGDLATGGGGGVVVVEDTANEAPQAGGDRGSDGDSFESGAPEPGTPDDGAGAGNDSSGGLDGAQEPPGFGATISDPVMPTVGAERVVTTPGDGTTDPTVIGTGAVEERSGRRGRTRVDELRALESSLQEQLDEVRSERDRLRRTADMLDR